jgi:dTDP-4-amino-4,6-dideoxygalactose transaminase
MKKIPLFKVYMNPRVHEPVLRTLFSGWIGQGERVAQFEKALSERIGNPNCLTLSAGTHGLHLALRLEDVGPGDSVITTPMTCTATNWPILFQLADIVWADIQPDTLNIDPKSVEKRIDEKTKAIICMHWGGYPCDLQELRDIADAYRLPLIEDAAHAFGATYRDSIIGDCKYSDYTMFSFQAIKHLTTVDGGALFTRSLGDYRAGKLLRWYGIDRDGSREDLRCAEDILAHGYKYHLNDVCASIGLSNLEAVEENLQKIRDNATYYREALKDVSGITLIQNATDRQPSYWMFTVLVDRREDFRRMMTEKGVMVSRVHERNDKHSCVKKFQRDDLSGLELVVDRMVCIPVGGWVTRGDAEFIAETIKAGW